MEDAQTVIRAVSATGDAPSGEPRTPGSSVSERSGEASDLPSAMPQTPAELTRRLQGQPLNHFRLIEQIGGGGMGAVFRARDEQLGREVAVKVVPFAGGDPELQRRFRNEAQSAAKLDHPLIARVFEVGSDGPWHYIVFEYVDGNNIRELVNGDGPLSIDEAVFFTCQLAEAIGHASRRGIVHRDIKPSNVIITQDGSIKLVDMGLARSENFDTSEDLTASGVTLGTFDYISPEQAHDPRVADIRSDLYSLGCTFYFMLTGSPPFPGGTMLQKLLSHGNAAVPDVRQSCPHASSDLANILNKMLAKQPDQRYQTSHALVADLRELAFREGLTRSRGVVAPASEDHGSVLWQRLVRHLPWMVAASLMLISVAWIELIAWQTRRDFSNQLAETRSPTAMDSVAPRTGYGDSDALNSSELSARAAPTNLPAVISVEGPQPTGNEDPDAPAAITPPSLAFDGSPLVPVPFEQNPRDGTGVNPPISMGDAGRDLDGSLGMTDRGSDDTELGPTPSAIIDINDRNAATMSVGGVDESRLRAADPPTLRGLPFPVDTSNGSPASSSLADETMALTSPTSNDRTNLDSDPRPFGPQPFSTDVAIESTLPQRIRIVDTELATDPTTAALARDDGTLLVDSLAKALEAAERSNLNRIELASSQLVSEPILIRRNNLIIESVVAGGTVVRFQSPAANDMQRSDMMTIGSNRIEMSNIHFHWAVPATETDGGAMFLLNENRQVQLSGCTVTIDNPSRRDAIHAFHVQTPSTRSEAIMLGSVGSRDNVPDTLPLVSIDLRDVIVRGQIGFLKMRPAAELQLRWENGLLAISRCMIDTAGSISRPRPTSGAIRLSLDQLTAMIPEGLVRMQLDSFTPFPVLIERRAEKSVFVVGAENSHVEIIGLGRDQRESSWLSLLGSANAYETDSTLGDALLVIRDLFGQTQVTTMNDLLAEDAPAWADDRTPRWVVRWSQPLPTDIAASRMVPADFRQDGSLVGGFDERMLPRLPPQQRFDFPPTE